MSFEEIAAATGQDPASVDVASDTECDYQDSNGFGVVTVIRVSDPAGHLSCTAQDGTYLGHPVEKVSGVGDTAVWSPTAMSICFVKGTTRVQISLTTQVSDPKAVSTGLAAKAVQRVP